MLDSTYKAVCVCAQARARKQGKQELTELCRLQDVCDRVSAEETGAKDAVAAMIKRLAHRNANVQLYTLEV